MITALFYIGGRGCFGWRGSILFVIAISLFFLFVLIPLTIRVTPLIPGPIDPIVWWFVGGSLETTR